MHRPINTLITAAALMLVGTGLAVAQTGAGSSMPSASSAAQQSMPSATSAGAAMPSGNGAQQPSPSATNQPAAGKPEGRVANAAITTDIQQREPQNHLTTVPNSVGTVYYFTDVRGLQGKTIKHRWIYQGKTMATVKFDIGGNRWRTWSSKSMLPGWTGKWTCETVGPNGHVINTTAFRYTQGGSAPPASGNPAGSSTTSGNPAGGSGRSAPSGAGGSMNTPSTPASGGNPSMPENNSAAHMPMQPGAPAQPRPSPSQ